MIRVIVTDPAGERWVHLFDESIRIVHVGRDPGNAIRVSDPRCSRRQLVLRRVRHAWSVEDVSGRGTTRLNGIGIDGAMSLSQQDEVTFGETTLALTGASTHEGTQPTVGATWSGEAVAAARDDVHMASASSAFSNVVRLAQRVAATDETVLIRGETGTGKEVLARFIHEQSSRSPKPLVVVNCPGLPESLFESELFGVEKGVATGVHARPGKLAQADGGTVLLDEIGDLPQAAQAKILRFLQDKTVDRVGGNAPVPLDVRIVAATNVDLEAAIATGRFRSDLFHRLSAFTVELPPLRERREDIPALVEHFLARMGGAARMDRGALRLLEGHDFPGNVRELELIVRQAALLCQDGVIGPKDLPDQIRAVPTSPGAPDDVEAIDAASRHDDADRLFDRVVKGGEDFWSVVRAPFLTRELSRRPIQALVARALSEAGGSYAGAARLFRVESEYRKFVDFLRHNQLRPGDR